jgi:nitroreductase
MDVIKTIGARYSVRKYKKKDIPDGDLDKILQAARLAPSAHNLQNYKIVIVKDQKKKDLLAQITGMVFVSQAPVVLVGIAPDSSSGYWPVDMAIIFDHIALSAVGLGLGTCWIGSIKDETKIRDIVSAPQDSKAMIVMPLGYPDHKALPKTRKSFEQLYSFEEF